jgi:hypothetical protein
MPNLSTRRVERAYFDALPLCTQRAIELNLQQCLEEKTLQAARRKLAQYGTPQRRVHQ